MSLRVTLTLTGLAPESLRELQQNIADGSGLHAQIAGDAEKFVKARGAQIAATEHRTANTLGAAPTGHLADAYEGIESISSATAATLEIPGSTRLRAAFGPYTLTPKNGSKYLTLPAAREAYGKRAREFSDLFFMRVGPRKTPVLAQREEGTQDIGLRSRTNQRRGSKRFTQARVMYVLIAKADIPEDRSLIPFEDLEAEATESAEEYIDSAIAAALPT